MTIPGVSANQLGKESYDGNWEEDMMSGFGVYSYADGAAYKG